MTQRRKQEKLAYIVMRCKWENEKRKKWIIGGARGKEDR